MAQTRRWVTAAIGAEPSGGGLRELPKHTPDGLPILDRVPPFANLFVATGHSMLGITLAPGSGQAMADFVLSGRRPALLEPFRVQRFAGH